LSMVNFYLFFFSSRRRHTRSYGDWSSDVCSSDLAAMDGFIKKKEEELQQSLADKQKAAIKAIDEKIEKMKDAMSGALSKLGKLRSEERRVGKECRCGWARRH